MNVHVSFDGGSVAFLMLCRRYPVEIWCYGYWIVTSLVVLLNGMEKRIGRHDG